ncbi:MAG: TIGR02266 family protein [Myxococcota bacterium]|nr:TIGR02266 family protein [Myxococcota bacterium]MDW8362522.1 TIGR02266 family protein [Myxococcales bacterium]
MSERRRRTSTPGTERRSHPRFEAHLEVDYAHGDTFLFAYVENISEMGIFVRTDDPARVGTRLTLRFSPRDAEPLLLQGEVVWINPVRPGGDNPNPGMGIRFVELSADQRERLVELVRTVAYLQAPDRAND